MEFPFTEDEIWNTIKDLPNEKASGPGFIAEFYKSAWSIIKPDVIAAFDAFYRNTVAQLHKLTGALITLLPKKQDAKMPGDYRPISLVHSFGKLLAKLLSNRLAPELSLC